MVCLSALLQVPLEGEASQFAQLLSILTFVIATFALIAAAPTCCVTHRIPPIICIVEVYLSQGFCIRTVLVFLAFQKFCFKLLNLTQ